MQPLVSIIIPLFNRQSIFEYSLKSALNQTYTNIELIVVDDGSTEFNILEMELPEQEGIPLIKIRQENRGAQAARNAGFRKSSGELVLFWDADIIAEPNFVATLCETLLRYPEAGYAYSNFLWGHKKMKAGKFDTEALKKQNYIHISAIIRRDVFMPFDERIKKFQDWDQWLALLQHGVAGVWVDEYLYKVIPGGIISSWLPRWAYKKPWKYIPGIYGIVKKYEDGKRIIQKKHRLA